MAIKSLSNTGIATGQTVQAAQVSQSINAFTATDDYRIKVSGSFVVTGSLITHGPSAASNFVRFPNVATKIATGSVGVVGIDPSGNLYSASVSSGTKGEKGAAGTKGDTGSKGSSGSKGEKGQAGSKGSVGPQGNQGPKGSTGTQGPGGTKGPTGDKGAQGDQGAAGPKGSTGPGGPQGPAGSKGSVGPKGSTGSKGSTGGAGPKGNDGTKGSEGPVGPAGPKGEKGQASTTAGPKGAEGPQGATGPKGETGAGGPKGEKGAAGPTGNAGPKGSVGPAGPKGEKGQASTTAGPKGAEGPVGPAGPKGEKGQTGPQGAQGNVGPQGTAGPKGEKGQKGDDSSVAGPKGEKGQTGTKGSSGPKGATGTSAGTVFNSQITYLADSSGADYEIYLQSTGNLYSGLAWSRSTNTLTVNSTAHGLSTGDHVMLRNVNVDYFYGAITVTGANAFTVGVADTGDTSGIGAYIPALKVSSVTNNSGDVTAVTIAAPNSGNVQLNNIRLFANNQETSPCTYTVPASLSNGVGGNTDKQDINQALCFANGFDGTGNSTSLGAVAQYNLGSNFNQIRISGIDNFSPVMTKLIF